MKTVTEPHTEHSVTYGGLARCRARELRVLPALLVALALTYCLVTDSASAYSAPAQSDFWGSAGCYPGYGTQDGNPRVVGWPTLMRRTPRFPTGTEVVFGGGGPAYGTTVTIGRAYSAQWLVFRVLVGYYDAAGVFRQVPGYWLGGWNSLGSQTNGIESWVYYNSRWEKTTYSNVPGGIEDWSFVRTQKGSRYHVRFEYRWGPITATENGRAYTVYAGDRVVVNYGWVQC